MPTVSLRVAPATRPSPGRRLPDRVRSRPVLAFFVWFFTVGQAFAFAPLVLAQRGVQVPHQPFIIGSTLVGLLLPAVVITRIVDGPDAVRALWHRAVRWRVRPGWYLLLLLGIPLTAVAVTVAVHGRPAGLSAPALGSALVPGLMVQLFLAFLPNNWAEEIAWMGFVQARFEKRHHPVVAALITAPLFALQHVSLAVGMSLGAGIVLIGALAVVAVPFRLLLGWTHHRTGSLFLVGLAHGIGNAVAGGSGFGAGLLPRLFPDSPLAAVAHLVAFAVLGTVVAAATGGRRARPGTAR